MSFSHKISAENPTMKSHLLVGAIRRGFRCVKTDSVEEWSSIRKAGFIRTWIKSTRLYPLFFPMISLIAAPFKKMPIVEALIGGFGAGVAMMILIGIADGLYWLSREHEWRKAQSAIPGVAKKTINAEQAGSSNGG
jgi:hypothetical protein